MDGIDEILDALETCVAEAATEEFNTLIKKSHVPTASGKAFRIWYKQFKPKWDDLQTMMRSACRNDSPKDVQKILWYEKELLLNTRDALTNIPESMILNVAAMLGIITVTVGLTTYGINFMNDHTYIENSVDWPEGVPTNIENPGPLKVPVHINWGIRPAMAHITRSLGVVFLVLKFFSFALTSGNVDLLKNQKFGGVISKQVLVMKVNGMIREVDAQLKTTYGVHRATIDRRIVQATEKYANKYVNQISDQFDKAAASQTEPEILADVR